MKPYEFIRILGICFGIPGSTLELLEIRWNSCGALEIPQDNLPFLNFPGLLMNTLDSQTIYGTPWDSMKVLVIL